MQSWSFKKYYFNSVVSPGQSFVELITDSRMLKYAVMAVMIPAILYSFVYIFLILGGGQPFEPWLKIPLEDYYKYNVFFCAPSMCLGWILAAGVVHTLSRIFTDTGSFEKTLSVFGFGISIASWTTGLHDFISSFLGAIHVINQREYEIILNTPSIWRTFLWIQMGAYLTWFIVLFSIGVRKVYKINRANSVIYGTLGFLVYQLFFLIFNR